MSLYLQLMTSFMKVGVLTFGGGYAMLPLLEKEIVLKQGWATSEELLDYFAIGQMTPGIIAVNTATFVGYKQKGISGAIFATLGMITPSIIIILIIASILSNLLEYPIVVNAFNGIKLGVSVILTQAIYKLAKKSLIDKFSIIVFSLGLLALLVLNLNPVSLILLVIAYVLITQLVRLKV